MIVWRIAADPPDYRADDRTGAGAKATVKRSGSITVAESFGLPVGCVAVN
jgi:hypothetical protein